jgi:hypothetical protein
MDIESEIQKIKERNARVEADKAWETSKTRRLAIAVFTYIVAVFLLSTLTMPFLKEWWVVSVYKK